MIKEIDRKLLVDVIGNLRELKFKSSKQSITYEVYSHEQGMCEYYNKVPYSMASFCEDMKIHLLTVHDVYTTTLIADVDSWHASDNDIESISYEGKKEWEAVYKLLLHYRKD